MLVNTILSAQRSVCVCVMDFAPVSLYRGTWSNHDQKYIVDGKTATPGGGAFKGLRVAPFGDLSVVAVGSPGSTRIHRRIDLRKTLRKSHSNPQVAEIYEHFLGEPLGHKSHELLHTEYFGKERI